MHSVRDRTFQNEVVALDDHQFINCHLHNCELRFCGAAFLLKDTSILGCRWIFGGCALRTLSLVSTFGLSVGGEFVDPSAELSSLMGTH